MDALIAKGDALGPPGKKRKLSHRSSSSKHQLPATATDGTVSSIARHTKLPKSFQSMDAAGAEGVPKHNHIANKKLRNELVRTSAQISRSKALLEDADMLLENDAGKIEVEDEMERTWRLDQKEISQSTGTEAAKGRQEWKLDGGPYRVRYTRNGR
jgi:U3 small nucleolar RNA-associated protein 7